jgi:hypothetical protein
MLFTYDIKVYDRCQESLFQLDKDRRLKYNAHNMRSRFYAILFAILILSVSLAEAQAAIQGVDFPNIRFTLKAKPVETPYPGLGNYYSALSKGLETVMWNPASLTDIKYAQGSVSIVEGSGALEYTRSYETDDGEINVGDQDEFQIGYYLTDDESVTTPATRKHTGHALIETVGTGINFKQGIKANDWLSFGILTHSNVGSSLDMSGIFPVTARSSSNFLNKSDILGTGMSIDNSGNLTFTYTPESGPEYTYSTTDPMWSGFLSQTSVVPVSMIVESRNDINVEHGVTMAGAFKWENISVGASLTPISANMNINNTARAVIKSGTPDVYIYQPDFDPEDEAGALNWIQDPNLYGSESGYKRNTINVPEGEVVAEGRYQGFYQSSAMRTDLGATVDFSDVLSLGIVLENFGGANLNFRGQGRVAYANTRISTEEPGGFEPGQEFHWNMFSDNFEPIEGSEDWFLAENMNVELPKKIRIGAALKKPFLIALDYETNQTPIRVPSSEGNPDDITISNLSMLRVGIETQFFTLPMWMRFGIPLMLKPNVKGATQEVLDGIDDAFQFGVLPVGVDLGMEINLYGTHVGGDFGMKPLDTIISYYQLDTLNLDLGKIGYYDVYVTHDPWKFTYLVITDPGSTARAYGNRTNKDEGFQLEQLKWIQTFTISYVF